jgi:hypothetical protein
LIVPNITSSSSFVVVDAPSVNDEKIGPSWRVVVVHDDNDVFAVAIDVNADTCGKTLRIVNDRMIVARNDFMIECYVCWWCKDVYSLNLSNENKLSNIETSA